MEVDAWLNLRTGVVSALNYTNSAEQATVRTFNPEYAGQVAQELTDAADVFTVSPNCLLCRELPLRPCLAVQPQQPQQHNERVAICLFIISHSLPAVQIVFTWFVSRQPECQ